MKTNTLYVYLGWRSPDAFTLGWSPDLVNEKPYPTSIAHRATSGVPNFAPAHIATGLKHAANGKVYKKWKEPARFNVGSNTFAPNRGKCDRIREIPESFVKEIQAIELEIFALEEQKRDAYIRRKAILARAYAAGKPITAKDAEEFFAEKRRAWQEKLDREKAEEGKSNV